MSAGATQRGGPCPPASVLDAIARGVAGDDEATASHVRACEACSKFIDEARRNAVFLRDVLRPATVSTATYPVAGGASRGVRGTWSIAKDIEEVGGYRLIREIGRGGQGVVYEGVQADTKRTVAIKMLLLGRTSERQRMRFEREAEIAASLRHPGLVTIYESVHLSDGRRAMVMEFVEGMRLDRWTENLGRPGTIGRQSSGRLLAVMAAVCDAVEHAHRHGVIHRDLKPGNILVEGGDQPRVLDFGLARRGERGEEALLTKTGAFEGTPAYSSPEQVSGDPDQVDSRTDVYTLGVILYEMLAGKLPYPVQGALIDVVKSITELPPTHPGRIDEELWTIVVKAMSKERERRYQTAGELRDDLRRYLAGEAINAKRDSTWYLLKKTTSKHRGKVAMAVLAVFAGAVMLVNLWVLNSRLQDNQVQLQRQLEHGEISLARAMAKSGDTGLAEKMLYERLGPVRKEANLAAIAFGAGEGDREALWALAEFASKHQCLASVRLPVSPTATLQVMRSVAGNGWFWVIDQYSGSMWKLTSDREMTVERGPGISSTAGQRILCGGTPRFAYEAGPAGFKLWRGIPSEEGAFEAAPVQSGAIPPGMAYVAWQAYDGGFVVMLTTGTLLRVLPDGSAREMQPGHTHRGSFSASVDPAGRYLWALSADETSFEKIDIETGAVVRREPLPPLLRGSGPLTSQLSHYSMAINEDGTILAITTDMRAAFMDLRRSSGAWVDCLRSIGYRRGVELSGDGRVAMMRSSLGGQAYVVNFETDQFIAEIGGHSMLNSCVMSRDGRRVMTADASGLVRLWGLGGSEWQTLLSGTKTSVTSVLFAEGEVLLAGDTSGQVLAWDDPSGTNLPREVLSLPDKNNAEGIALGGRGRVLGIAGSRGSVGSAVLREGVHGELERMFSTATDATTCAAVSQDGRWVAYAGREVPITLLDRKTGELTSIRGNYGAKARAPFAVFSPDGSWLVWGELGSLYIRSMKTGRIERSLPAHLTQVRAGAFSSDGTLFATGGDDRVVCTWDTRHWTLLRRLTGSKGNVATIKFHPQGKVLVTGDFASSVRVWEIESGHELAGFDAEAGIVFSLDFAPGGERLAVGTQFHGAQIWDFQELFDGIQRSWAPMVARERGVEQ